MQFALVGHVVQFPGEDFHDTSESKTEEKIQRLLLWHYLPLYTLHLKLDGEIPKACDSTFNIFHAISLRTHRAESCWEIC